MRATSEQIRNAKLERLALLEEKAKRAARAHLLPFTLWTMPSFRTNWHHQLLCRYLEDFVALRINRLIVSMPPRMGKSELVGKRLPAFILGGNPNARIIGASYSSKLAVNNSRAIKRVINDPRYKELFPGTKLGRPVVTDVKQEAKNTADEWEIVGHEGGYRCSGVGGSVTGFGGKYLIIDDPVKGRKEAESRTQQDALWSWYNDDLLTRGEEPFGVLINATRWGLDDLTGKVLKDFPGEWTVLELPAIKEEGGNPEDPRQIGEPLWPEWFGGLRTPLSEMPSKDELIAKAIERYARIKAHNPYGWSSLFQQHPVPAEGNVIKVAWTNNRWKSLPEGPGEWIISWDLRAGGESINSSYAVGQVWFRPDAMRGRFYLVYQIRARLEFDEELSEFQRLVRLYPQTGSRLVEKKADGNALINTLSSKITGIVPVKLAGGRDAQGKRERLEATVHLWQAGNVWLPDDSIAPWMPEYVGELINVPSWPTWDQADATSQALNYWIAKDAQGGNAEHPYFAMMRRPN